MRIILRQDLDSLGLEGEMVNVTVVDTNDNNIVYYITGEPEIFNAKKL